MAEDFTKAFGATYPELPVYDRECFTIPHLDHDELEAGRKDPATHTAEDTAAYALGHEITEELINCKHLVIATPMYNWYCMQASHPLFSGPLSSVYVWMCVCL